MVDKLDRHLIDRADADIAVILAEPAHRHALRFKGSHWHNGQLTHVQDVPHAELVK
jgi:hypothetical protein